MDIVKIIFPIFSIIGLGYALRHIGIIREEGTHMLNQFVYYVSLPAIIFISFFRIDWHNSEIVAVLISNVFIFLAFSAILLLFIWLLPIKNEYKAALFAASLVGNTIYMGFPISRSALGAEQFTKFVAAATPHLVVGIAFALMAVEFFVIRSRKISAYFKDLFLNPLIISMAGGVIMSVMAINDGALTFIIPPIEMLAGTASPLALTTLGAFLYGKFAREHLGLSLLVICFKLAVFPLFIFATWRYLFPHTGGMEASLLAAAMPTAVTVFVIAERYNIAPKFIAHVILLTTLLSVATIPIVLWLI